ncbi:MAG: RNase adapter RapZ [Clostridia bacterium]|nr:RNase adapter RapZ [Clostridia bacterium]
MYILIVTGLSGAGKSHALNALEDMGFVCADNMPCDLLRQYIELCMHSENKIERVALVIDSRESVFGYNPQNTYYELQSLPYAYEIMFLDCEDAVLQQRYSETRRKHPLHDDVSIGIRMEREMLTPLREKANYVIDTTNMRSSELARTVEGYMLRGEKLPMRLIITSFGYKRGVPASADFIFDMRYTPNPFYIPELRYKSGRDKEVRDYVFSDPIVNEQLDSIENMLRMLIPSFMEQGKRRLMVAFGCTGGRHRSVAMAEALHDRLGNDFSILLEHRDLISEADDIKERFTQNGKPDTDGE